MGDRRCAHCGKSIALYHGKSGYCGDACRMKAYRLQKKEQRAAEALRPCKQCAGPIAPEKPPWTIFCSKACLYQWGSDRRSERRKEARSGRICPECEEPLPSDRDYRAIYCSKRCKQRRDDRERGRIR